jgi:protoheme IX farnesyltransferase
MKSESNTLHTISFRAIFLDFKEITKAGLAISVLFSSIAGYLLGFDQIILSMVSSDYVSNWWVLHGWSV